MFGSLRFFLAAVVVTFHAGLWPFGLYSGVSAVIVFYILSGYVITALLTKRFPGLDSYGAFLAERTIRIAPQYYFWLALAYVSIFWLKLAPPDVAKPNSWTVFSYLALLPLGLQRYLMDVNSPLLGQATSLAIECIIYLMAPFLVRSRRLSLIAASACLVVFLASATRGLPPQIFTYYTAPAQLVFFLLGSFIYRRDWVFLWTTAGALLAILALGHKWQLFPEMMIGVVVGLPAIILLKDRSGGRLDAAFGAASYGAFLCQGTVLYALLHFGFTPRSPIYIALALVLSCAAGYASYLLIERPTVGLRRRFRGARPAPVTEALA